MLNVLKGRLFGRFVIVTVASATLLSAASTHCAFALEKANDANLASQEGEGRFYAGACDLTGTYNCGLDADGVTCHRPVEGANPDQNPDSYIDTAHSYRRCSGNFTIEQLATCDMEATGYVTVERQYYQANWLRRCGTARPTTVYVCTHDGCARPQNP